MSLLVIDALVSANASAYISANISTYAGTYKTPMLILLLLICANLHQHLYSDYHKHHTAVWRVASIVAIHAANHRRSTRYLPELNLLPLIPAWQAVLGRSLQCSRWAKKYLLRYSLIQAR